MYEAIRDVDNSRQTQGSFRYSARRVMKRDGFHDRIGEAPQAQKIRADLSVMRLHLRGGVLAGGRVMH